MYCKYCGKEIDNDSKFCCYCGKELDVNHDGTIKSANNEIEEKDRSKGIIFGIIIFIIVFTSFLLAICTIIESNGKSCNETFVIGRNIKDSDYEVFTSQGLMSYTITISPNVNIKTCSINLTLYDSKGNNLYSDTITKTNLKKNSSYSYTFEFGFVNSLSGNKVYYTISGKC